MDVAQNRRTVWVKKILNCLREQVKKQIIKWLKEQVYCERITAFILHFVVIPILSVWVGYLFFMSIGKDENGTQYLIWLTAGVVGWYFLFRRTKAAELNARATEQGLTVDRLTHATKQLKSKELFIRLGGVLSLEQIAITDEEESKKIAHIFASFIRKRATEKSGEVLETEEQFYTHRMQNLDIEASVNALALIASNLGKQEQFQDYFKEVKYHLCNLQDIDLRGLWFVKTDLTGFDFARADLRGARLIKTILSRANLNSANLSNAQSEEVTLIRTSLIDADLSGARLEGAGISRADLTRSNLVGVKLAGADLAHAKLNGANLTEAGLAGADLTNAKLNKANLAGAYLVGADLANAELNRAYLAGANIMEANLTNAKLNEADLAGVDLAGTDLASAELNKADLAGANMMEVNLANVELSGANLSKALLLDANLSEAQLESVDFSGAVLNSAILDGANIKGSVLKNTDFSSVSLSGIQGLTQEQVDGTYCRDESYPVGLPDELKPPPGRKSSMIEDE